MDANILTRWQHQRGDPLRYRPDRDAPSDVPCRHLVTVQEYGTRRCLDCRTLLPRPETPPPTANTCAVAYGVLHEAPPVSRHTWSEHAGLCLGLCGIVAGSALVAYGWGLAGWGLGLAGLLLVLWLWEDR